MARMSRNAWTPAEDALLASLPVTEVLKRTSRSMPSIIARRVRLKKQGVPIADQRTSAEKLKVGKSVWTPAAD